MKYIDEEVSTIISLIAIIVISIIRVYYKIINDEKKKVKPQVCSQGTQTEWIHWIPNCWDHGGEGSWTQKYAYLSLKEIKETIIKGEHPKTQIDSVSLDFKTTERGKPRRSEEEAIKLMEEMDGETIVKAWFKKKGKNRTRVSRENEPDKKVTQQMWEAGAYKWHSIIEIIN